MLKKLILLLLCVAPMLFTGAPAYAARHVSASSALTQEETDDLLFTREEEKVARDTYLTSYDTWGLEIFSNISSSEQSHMDAMLKLLEKYNLPDPAAGKAIGEFTNPTLQTLYNTLEGLSSASALSALKVGGLIEETDIRDIKAAVARSQHPDITKTYETLMCGSRNHLRSFAQSVEVYTGTSYVAQVLSQDEVNQILAEPMEKCGPSRRKFTVPPGKQ
ncbi:MAG TPA: DUF2202 domain-containing protein [Gallionellaceae bacterium]|nr:DUF2202 domain-containing protein [Gallionellaceae bacterium]